MNGLMEFVFEDISRDHLARMIIDSIGGGENVTDAVRDGVDVPLTSISDAFYWNDFGTSSEDTACTINLRTLKIGAAAVDLATLRIVHYGDSNDVTILVSSSDWMSVNMHDSDEIFQWAQRLAEEYTVANFFGGFEPATDEDMQLFSKARGLISEF